MSTARIGFPTKCRYRGGNRSLGERGRQLRITEGEIGYGTFRLSHAVPLDTVERVAVTERTIEAVDARPLLARGIRVSGRGSPKGGFRVFTDICVHTKDGQTALWIVDQRDAEWVRKKLAPVLKEHKIPFD